MYVGLGKWGDVIEWCTEAVSGVSACTILTSGCCAWMPYHIESAIEYAPPPGDTIIYIRSTFWLTMWFIQWYAEVLVQDVCTYVHTYILTEWVKGNGPDKQCSVCDLHNMNLKSCSIHYSMSKQRVFIYEERVTSQFHGITLSAQLMVTTIS